MADNVFAAFACSSRKRRPVSTAGTAQAHAAPGHSAAAVLMLQPEPEPLLATQSDASNSGAATPLRHSSRSRDPRATSSTPSRKRKASQVACPVPPSGPTAASASDQRSGSNRRYYRPNNGTADQATPSNFGEQHQDKSDSSDNPDGGSNGGDGGGADAVPAESIEKLGGVPERLGDSQPLRLIIIGHNPSEASWKAGHVYAHPANWMWRILSKTGIAPPCVRGAQDDDLMPALAGVGFTDLGTGHPGTDSSSFSSAVLLTWRDEFYERLRNHLRRTAAAMGCSCGRCGAPALVAFSGKRMFVELLNAGVKGKARVKSVEYGTQSARPPGWPLPASTEVWVCTSTSGAAPMSNAQREEPYAALAQRLAQVPWPRRVTATCGAGAGAGTGTGAGAGAGAGSGLHT